MSLREPSTRSPTNSWGESLDRYNGYAEIDCPDCDSTGVDVWMSEGAVTARGVCIDCGAEIDEDELRACCEEGSA